MSNPNTPAPGWYPAPHANNEQRYWDGSRWLEGTPAGPTAPVAAGPVAEKPKRRLKWWHWALVALGAIILISGIGNALSGGRSNADPAPGNSDSASKLAAAPTAAPADQEDPAVEEEPEPLMVKIPDLAGSTAEAAAAKLRALGLEPQVNNKDDADVTGTDPAFGETVEEGSSVIILAKDKPELTLAQRNAVSKAEDYIAFMAFSKKGLIHQLEYEGFSKDDAAFAVENIDVDWKEQAAQKAQDYLDSMSFSRQGLIDQLEYEGFSDKQIAYAIKSVGY